MCVALSFLFGYLLSTRCVYPQIGRAFEAPIGHKTLLCGHMVLLAHFIEYFLKKNYSLHCAAVLAAAIDPPRRRADLLRRARAYLA